MSGLGRPGRLRWWIVFGLVGPITFVMSLDRTAIVVAAPTIQQEYGFTLLQMSLVLTSFNWTYAALQVPAGWLAQRFGPRRALAWANIAWSVLTIATPLGFGMQSFVAIRMLLGAGQAADWPASVLALKRWFPRQERSQGNSVLLGGLYLGPIAAAPLTTLVIASFGWRTAFYLFGSLGVILGAATTRGSIRGSRRGRLRISRPGRIASRHRHAARSCGASVRSGSGRSGCSISSWCWCRVSTRPGCRPI